MTDAEYDILKKRMQKAAYARGEIKTAKSNVAFYTGTEMHAEENMLPYKAEVAHKKVIYWLVRLDLLRNKYAAI